MPEPSRCRFCDEITEGGAYCDSGCKAGFTLFAPKDEDDDEPTAAPTASAQTQTGVKSP